MNYNILFLTSFITLIPIIILKYKGLPNLDNTKTSIITFIWLIMSIVITILCTYLLKYQINYLIIIPTALLLNIYNFYIIKGKIDLKYLPKTALVIVIFFSASLFRLIPIKIFAINTSTMSPLISSLLSLFTDICVLIACVSLYFKDLVKDFKALLKNFNSIFDSSFKYWFIGLMVMIISNLLINLLAPNSTAGNEQAVQSMLSSSPLITFICAGLLAPFIEELVFRKAFKDIIKSPWLFILTSGIVFGSLHVVFSLKSIWDLLYIIPYSSLGIAFAYILEKTDNIYSSVMMHLIHNVMLTSISILTAVVMLP
ncbi:MAG: type II CAAX endopeptidase family protein [Bacilli bacterium]